MTPTKWNRFFRWRGWWVARSGTGTGAEIPVERPAPNRESAAGNADLPTTRTCSTSVPECPIHASDSRRQGNSPAGRTAGIDWWSKAPWWLEKWRKVDSAGEDRPAGSKWCCSRSRCNQGRPVVENQGEPWVDAAYRRYLGAWTNGRDGMVPFWTIHWPASSTFAGRYRGFAPIFSIGRTVGRRWRPYPVGSSAPIDSSLLWFAFGTLSFWFPAAAAAEAMVNCPDAQIRRSQQRALAVPAICLISIIF